jgi:predicted SnoaL-like aldol condensation-catalyzing enzyme
VDNKELVLAAGNALFGERDLSAVDRYWSPSYIQHSSMAAPGVEGLRSFVASMPEGARVDFVRVLAEDDLVVVHAVYHGLAPEPMVAFDVFRVADGRLAEHWDAMQPEVSQTASGRSMTDGPTEVREPELTAQNKEFVRNFVETVLVRGDVSGLADFYDGDSYAQHNPFVGDGLHSLTAAIEALLAEGRMFRYSKVHRLIAEGEFVLVISEGTWGGPTAFYDLFRVADGKIAEHWDVVFPIPETLPHDNGLF